MYDSIKRYYGMRLYSIEQVKVFVVAKWIDEQQFLEITGEEYIA